MPRSAMLPRSARSTTLAVASIALAGCMAAAPGPAGPLPGAGAAPPAGPIAEREDGTLTVAGLLIRLEASTWQYGSHMAGGFALRGPAADLDRLVGQRVVVTGRRIPGYPISGGPPLLQVISVAREPLLRPAR